jgi:hypothetical protein
MNSYSERHDNPRFKKMMIRDMILLIIISMFTACGVVFSLWAASKGIID